MRLAELAMLLVLVVCRFVQYLPNYFMFTKRFLQYGRQDAMDESPRISKRCGSAAVPFLLAISAYGLQPKADTASRPPAAAQTDTVQIRDAVVGSSDIERTCNQAVSRNHKWRRTSKCANDTRQCCRGDARIEPVLQSL